jgi:hypothetical protein
MVSCSLTIALASFSAVPAAASEELLRATISVVNWRADLKFFADLVVRRHPAPFTHVSKADFDAAVADLDRQKSYRVDASTIGSNSAQRTRRSKGLLDDAASRWEPLRGVQSGFQYARRDIRTLLRSTFCGHYVKQSQARDNRRASEWRWEAET